MDIKSQRGTMSFMLKVIRLMQTQNPFVRLVPAQRSPDPMRPHFYTAASLAESLDVSRRTVSRCRRHAVTSRGDSSDGDCHGRPPAHRAIPGGNRALQLAEPRHSCEAPASVPTERVFLSRCAPAVAVLPEVARPGRVPIAEACSRIVDPDRV